MITSEQLNNFKEGQICFLGTCAYFFNNLDLKRKEVNLTGIGSYIENKNLYAEINLSVSLKNFLDDFFH